MYSLRKVRQSILSPQNPSFVVNSTKGASRDINARSAIGGIDLSFEYLTEFVCVTFENVYVRTARDIHRRCGIAREFHLTDSYPSFYRRYAIAVYVRVRAAYVHSRKIRGITARD